MATLHRFRRFSLLAALLAVVIVVAVVLAQWVRLPRLTEEQARETIITTIQRETPRAFLVTGTLDITASVTVASEKLLLPGVLDLSLGTTSATVRAPGRVTYGFDVRRLRADHIRLEGDSVVVVTLPPLSVLSAEPDLSRLEVETRVGWARLQRSSGERTERAALAKLTPAMREQGGAYLSGNALQPRVNTSEAMEAMLRPAFAALGHGGIRMRFHLGPEIVRQGEGR